MVKQESSCRVLVMLAVSISAKDLFALSCLITIGALGVVECGYRGDRCVLWMEPLV